MRLNILMFTMVVISLMSCSSIYKSNENRIEIVPWKFVSEKDAVPPDRVWGRVPVTKEEAEYFDVILGWRKFQEVTGKSASRLEKLKKLELFARKQIIALGYCTEAEVPLRFEYILGWEGSGDRGITVACKN